MSNLYDSAPSLPRDYFETTLSSTFKLPLNLSVSQRSISEQTDLAALPRDPELACAVMAHKGQNSLLSDILNALDVLKNGPRDIAEAVVFHLYGVITQRGPFLF